MNFNLNHILAEEVNQIAAKLQKPGLSMLEIAEIRGQIRLLNKLVQRAYAPKKDYDKLVKEANDRANEEVEGLL